ncbi:hypothetical protein DSC45_02335 [Streptomyces sp. YIM 130001]|uniref:DUF4307 domain-containing protein n=1 Tax=Streptomyces sp. YIM 130001 TaxID=2259644 RepID=UPI000E64D608|nr:DUF4307 domain-containing protein [Streptomyces sp. YIM 130001]RII20942.1 hypothetical protein DSC45_02335 [Streptomyces sp. YIM 130001]
MSTVPDQREQLPEGRYGRSEDARADRKLKIVGSVLAVVMLGVIAWIGVDYIGGKNAFNGEMIRSKVVSDESVAVHLEIHKDPGTRGVCTVRALAENGAEVGRKNVTFAQHTDRLDEVVTVRTTSRATAAELISCESD